MKESTTDNNDPTTADSIRGHGPGGDRFWFWFWARVSVQLGTQLTVRGRLPQETQHRQL